MTDEAALLENVIAHPSADEPRLILADFWDEHGQHERAEFVRAGVMMSRYTDCPERLRDSARGRSLPLRDGVCEYCTARRRCERLGGKVLQTMVPDSIPEYAWTLETGPLDWIDNSSPGIYLQVARGFPAAVTLPAAAWLEHGPRLVRAAPIERVTLTDKRPGRLVLSEDDTSPRRRWWADTADNANQDTDELPGCLFDRLRFPGLSGYVFPDERSALAALSAACLSWAKEAGGLRSEGGDG